MNVRPSMGTVGDAYDNAMAESFFATLECELIARRKWETKTRARMEITTGCFAPVDKTPHVPVRGTSPCPQAGPVDNPAMVIINENPETTRV
jgi:transposase InsO family protein